MPELRAILADEAADVPAYDVGATVLRAARRQRRWRTSLTAAAIVAAVLGGGGLFVTLRSGGPAADVVAADRPATAHSVPWLPATVDTTVPEPPLLPLDRAVGRGALIYQRCNLCPARLVTEDGNQYALRKFSQVPPTVTRRATLSPDGRWLSYPDAAGNYLLRDLTGTQTVPLGSRRATGWSADSAWVGVADASSERGVEAIAPPTTTAAARPLPANDGRPLAGMTSTGGAVFGTSQAGYQIGDTAVSLYLVDENGSGRSVPITLSGQITGKDDPHTQLVRTVDDGTVVWQLMRQVNDNEQAPGDLLRIDTETGEVVARIRLPEPTASFRTLAGVVPDGVLLTVFRDGHPAGIELLDLDTGDRSTVTTLTGDTIGVVVRGES